MHQFVNSAHFFRSKFRNVNAVLLCDCHIVDTKMTTQTETPEVELDREAETLADKYIQSEQEKLLNLRKTFVTEYKALRRHFEILLIVARARHHGDIQMRIPSDNLSETIACFTEYLNNAGYSVRMQERKQEAKLSQSDKTTHHAKQKPAQLEHAVSVNSSPSSSTEAHSPHNASSADWLYIITKRF